MNKVMHTSLAAVFTACSSMLQSKEFLEQEEKQNKKSIILYITTEKPWEYNSSHSDDVGG